MIPTWTYVKSDNGIYVNLFIGSTIKIENVAGINVEMVQETTYPWKGDVSISVNPEQSKEFTRLCENPKPKNKCFIFIKPRSERCEIDQSEWEISKS